jgi:hypothetical protein
MLSSGLWDWFTPIPQIARSIRSRWSKKRRVGHSEGLCKGASHNKAILRLLARSKRTIHDPPTPTSATMRSADGRTQYRIWSDGSYRKMVMIKGRKLIPI